MNLKIVISQPILVSLGAHTIGGDTSCRWGRNLGCSKGFHITYSNACPGVPNVMEVI